MTITINPRVLLAFVAGLAVAAVAVFAVQAWRVDAAPGDADATFVPIAPCRLADTRPAPNRVGVAGTFSADDTKIFTAQGDNGECTVPTDAVGLSLNVTALGATAPTFVTVWPDGERPLASSLNPAPNQPPTPNAVTTTLSDTGTFNVYNLAGTLDLIIDVNGFYTKASLAQLHDEIEALKTAQPFAVNSRETTDVGDVLGAEYAEFVSVEVTAPVDGHVTLMSVAGVQGTQNTARAVCALVELSDDPIQTSVDLRPTTIQVWTPRLASVSEPLTGSGVFDIDGGATETFSLVCRGATNTSLHDRSLSAIFTPAP